MKKLVSLLLAALMVLSLASAFAETVDTSNRSPILTVDNNTLSLPLVPEKETFTVTVKKRPLSKNNFSEKECAIKTEEETNVHIEWNEIPESGWKEKINIMFASGDLTDLFVGGIDVVANHESLLPLNDLIKENAPYMSKLFEERPEFYNSLKLADGNIYSLPTGSSFEPDRVGDIAYINTEWLQKLNLEIPTTTEEFYQVLKAFKEKDPNGNGLNDEIPFSFVGSTDLYPLFGAFGVIENNEHIQIRNDKVVFSSNTEGFRAALEFFNKLYTEGLMDMEGFSQTQDQLTAKGKQSPSVLGVALEYNSQNLVGMDNVESYQRLPTLKTEGFETYYPEVALTDGNLSGFAISSTCKDPATLIKWYDYLSSDFTRRTRWSFGPENSTWKYTEEGLWTNTTEFLPEGMTYGEMRHTVSAGAMAPCYASDGKVGLKYFDETAMERFESLYVLEPFFPEQIMPAGFDDPSIKEERDILYTDIDPFVKNFIATSILEGVDDAKWDDYKNKLNALNVTEYVRLWQETYNIRK